jgi:hypothetical protein
MGSRTWSDAQHAAQRALRASEWGATGLLGVRMALHTGEARPEDGQYASNRIFNRISRVLSSGFGGQILLTLATQESLRRLAPDPADVGPAVGLPVRAREHVLGTVVLLRDSRSKTLSAGTVWDDPTLAWASADNQRLRV